MSEPYESPVRNQLYQLGIFLWTARESNPTHIDCKSTSPKPWNMAAHYLKRADTQTRTEISGLEDQSTNHCAIPANWRPPYTISYNIYSGIWPSVE